METEEAAEAANQQQQQIKQQTYHFKFEACGTVSIDVTCPIKTPYEQVRKMAEEKIMATNFGDLKEVNCSNYWLEPIVDNE